MTPEARLKIIVEGNTDAQIIRAILGEVLAKKVKIFAGQGRASLASVGRNILVHEGGPVLLVMDSDTLDLRLAAELESMTKVAMSGALTSGAQYPVPTSAGTPEFRVFTFIPEIEAAFFEAPEALHRMLGKSSSEEKVRDGCRLPKHTLSELLSDGDGGRKYVTFFSNIDPGIASGAQAKELKKMVELMLSR